jgi:hypothetical protein
MNAQRKWPWYWPLNDYVQFPCCGGRVLGLRGKPEHHETCARSNTSVKSTTSKAHNKGRGAGKSLHGKNCAANLLHHLDLQYDAELSVD